jgi:hypothetical protein
MPVAKAVEKVVVAWACEGRKEATTIAVEEVVVPWPVSGNIFLGTSALAAAANNICN